MIRKFGVRVWWRYEQARRSGMTIDYAQIFSRDDRAILGEHFSPVPWEKQP